MSHLYITFSHLCILLFIFRFPLMLFSSCLTIVSVPGSGLLCRNCYLCGVFLKVRWEDISDCSCSTKGFQLFRLQKDTEVFRPSCECFCFFIEMLLDVSFIIPFRNNWKYMTFGFLLLLSAVCSSNVLSTG